MINNYLNTDLKFIKGIGEKTADKFYTLLNGGQIVREILYHFPVDFLDRTYNPEISSLLDGTSPVGKVASFKVEILQHKKGYKRSPYKVICSDGTGRIAIPFFNVKYADWIREKLPPGQVRVISGKVDKFRGELSMSHPDYILDEKYFNDILAMETIYPLTAGLPNKSVRGAITRIINHLDKLAGMTKSSDKSKEADITDEWIDKKMINQDDFPSWLEAMKAMHFAKDRDALEPDFLPRKRLAYDEILASQLALALLHRDERELKGISTQGDGRYVRKLLDALPFDLTSAQKRSVDDIFHDMALPKRMLRLLQGDVGSGKTVVALMALLNAVEAGGQAVLMAPTDLLVRQHYKDLFELLNKAGLLDEVPIELITGKDKASVKREKLGKLASGQVKIAVGTHSLFQDKVEFENLTLAVIDEQHRFGVGQRLNLVSKAKDNPADVLAMSATPIPRTLTMTIYGDMDLSIIDELPPGRQPITTTTLSLEKLDELTLSLKGKISTGEKIYWVCPLIEESDKMDFAAVETRFRYLQERLGGQVAFVHGKTDKDERDAIMQNFKNPNGTVKVLVSTTVIEVGVNVPDATIMVIENSERFGLSQLHQLRGRIGRGEKKSTCVLLFGNNVTPIAKQRLIAMKETQDGFVLAEEDLKLRGAGEILGTKQSGFPRFKVADYGNDKELFYVAKDDVKMILHKDPYLQTDRGRALRCLLKLSGKDKDLINIIAG